MGAFAALRGLVVLEPPQEIPVLTVICRLCGEELYLKPTVTVMGFGRVVAEHLWTQHQMQVA